MKAILLLTILLFGYSLNGQDEIENDIKGFNKFLGGDKAKAFNEATKSFNLFIKANFKEQNNQSDRTKAFIEQLLNTLSPDTLWILKTDKNKKIIGLFESSGLRNEIWVYGYENYNPKYNIYELLATSDQEADTIYELGTLDLELIEEQTITITINDSLEYTRREEEMKEKLKNSLWFNERGEFLYGLAKYAPNDSVILGYVESKADFGNISPSIIGSVFIEYVKDFDEPFIKRIIVVEFYYRIMNWDIERKRIKNNETPVE
jgi:hypothetical protein